MKQQVFQSGKKVMEKQWVHPKKNKEQGRNQLTLIILCQLKSLLVKKWSTPSFLSLNYGMRYDAHRSYLSMSRIRSDGAMRSWRRRWRDVHWSYLSISRIRGDAFETDMAWRVCRGDGMMRCRPRQYDDCQSYLSISFLSTPPALCSSELFVY